MDHGRLQAIAYEQTSKMKIESDTEVPKAIRYAPSVNSFRLKLIPVEECGVVPMPESVHPMKFVHTPVEQVSYQLTAKQIKILELAYGKQYPPDFSITPRFKLSFIARRAGTSIRYVRKLLNGGYKVTKDVLAEMFTRHLDRVIENKRKRACSRNEWTPREHKIWEELT